MFCEEIVMEIDKTLDQLIRNAEVIQKTEIRDLPDTELDAFQKTQESLLQHLLHMDQFLETKRKNLRLQDKRSASYKIQEKLLKFEKLKSSYQRTVAKSMQRRRSLLLKRRTKRFIKT